jgi:hypothetical protein
LESAWGVGWSHGAPDLGALGPPTDLGRVESVMKKSNLVKSGEVVASVSEEVVPVTAEEVASVIEAEQGLTNESAADVLLGKVDVNKEAADILLGKEGVSKATVVAGGGSKYIGLKSGRRVQDFQDWQLSVNHERKLTDLQILAEMKAEFPEATGAIFVAGIETRLSILRTVRRLYNAGRHCKAWPKPEVPSVEFKGEPVAAS